MAFACVLHAWTRTTRSFNLAIRKFMTLKH